MTDWEFRQLVRAIITRLDHLEDRTDRIEMYQADIRENLARLSGSPPQKEKISKAEYIICGVILLYILWLLDPSFVKTLRGFVTPMRP